ncbi:MAG: hypothetical protein LLF83_06120 [Methanobacterium sp.]|nr:hypothetical protein [Methanobacterium sp.]
MNKICIGILILIMVVVSILGLTSPTTVNNPTLKTFDKGGISLQYPGNWNEKPIPQNDQNLTAQSGFQMLNIILEGNNLADYTVYMGIGKGNINNNNLSEASDRLYKHYISSESGDYLLKTNTTLKNGYPAIEYVYGGTGASSGKPLDCKTYIFTKDYKTAYYIQFATPRGGFLKNKSIFQAIMDSVVIN